MLGNVANHISPHSAEAKDEWSYASTPHMLSKCVQGSITVPSTNSMHCVIYYYFVSLDTVIDDRTMHGISNVKLCTGTFFFFTILW
jgi:hypothetical protein